METDVTMNATSAPKSAGVVLEIPVDQVVPSELNPRTHFDEDRVRELAESIRENGQLQAIVVVPISDGRYEIVMGERRWRACKLAGLPTVRAEVRDASAHSHQDHAVLAMIENLQREDLDPIDEAMGLQKLKDLGLKVKDIAKRLGVDPSTISNRTRVLQLPEAVIAMIRDRRLSPAHGVTLVRWAKFPELVTLLAETIIEEEIPSKELDREGLTILDSFGSIPPHLAVDLRDARFDTTQCSSCPFDALGTTNWRKLCLRPSHFDELNVEARAAALKAAEPAAVDGKKSKKGAIDLSALRSGTDYEDLSYQPANGPQCSKKACTCYAMGVHPHRQGTIPVCMDPSALRKKKLAVSREQKAKRRVEVDELRSVVDAELDNGTVWHDLAPALIAKRLFADGSRWMKVAISVATRMGIELPVIYSYSAEEPDRMAFFDALAASATPGRLKRFVVECLLDEALTNRLEAGARLTDEARWYIGRIRAASLLEEVPVECEPTVEDAPADPPVPTTTPSSECARCGDGEGVIYMSAYHDGIVCKSCFETLDLLGPKLGRTREAIKQTPLEEIIEEIEAGTEETLPEGWTFESSGDGWSARRENPHASTERFATRGEAITAAEGLQWSIDNSDESDSDDEIPPLHEPNEESIDASVSE